MPNFLLTIWDTLNSSNIGILVAAGLGMFAVIGGLAMLSYHYTLGSIKSRTVGDGQHGTARWATDKEIHQAYPYVPTEILALRIVPYHNCVSAVALWHYLPLPYFGPCP